MKKLWNQPWHPQVYFLKVLVPSSTMDVMQIQKVSCTTKEMYPKSLDESKKHNNKITIWILNNVLSTENKKAVWSWQENEEVCKESHDAWQVRNSKNLKYFIKGSYWNSNLTSILLLTIRNSTRWHSQIIEWSLKTHKLGSQVAKNRKFLNYIISSKFKHAVLLDIG